MYKKIVAVTNRHLCCEDLLKRIDSLAYQNLDSIILREKDLSYQEYLYLSKNVLKICKKHDTPLFLHNFVDAALSLNHKNIHIPLNVFIERQKDTTFFNNIGTSTHSLQDAITAQKLGASYITLGHIFKTSCKKDLKPRGLGLLSEVCQNISIPVYAIGGITHKNAHECFTVGSKKICIMSGLMRCENIKQHLYMF